MTSNASSFRLSRRGLLAAGAAVPLAAAFPDAAAAQTTYTGYLMAHFVGEGSGGEQIYFAHSDDGLNWTDLNLGQIVLRTPIGTLGVRDPVIVRSPSGDRYWIVATDLHIGSGTSWSDASNNGSTSLVVWTSTDLVNWSLPWLFDVAGSISDAGDAWAPEAIYDSSSGNYVLYWATNSTVNDLKKHRVWWARTSDFTSLSTTPAVYQDPSGSQDVIDTQIIEVSDSTGGYRYYRASKQGQILIEGSNSILSGWTTIGDLSGLGLDAGDVEGPMWSKFNGQNKWALWLDQHGTGDGYMPLTSTNLGSTANFATVSDYDLGSNLKRHGSIISLTSAEETRVLDRYESPVFNRLQSYNYQTRYVRHYNFDVQIDASVSPAADAQFRLVTGLADDGYVSFESVNYPGYFLRHADYDLTLVANDGTTQFAQDATFLQTAGLADSSWSSFQSYNYPSRYLRHYNYLLRIDAVSTSTELADATFRVTT